jgi:hypothetical protein
MSVRPDFVCDLTSGPEVCERCGAVITASQDVRLPKPGKLPRPIALRLPSPRLAEPRRGADGADAASCPTRSGARSCAPGFLA